MKRFLILSVLAIISLAAFCAEPAVKWDCTLSAAKGGTATLTITATIEPGYHLFAQSNPEGGSLPLVITFESKGCVAQGKMKANKQYIKEFDDVFEVEQHYYTGSVTFTQQFKTTKADFAVKVGIKGQACNDSGCKNINEVIELQPCR